jgi:TRAP-type uncharacterized transport system fused permease subunit
MKLTKQLLIIIVFLAALMPLYAGYLSLTNDAKLYEMFHVTVSGDMSTVTTILGLFFFSFGLVYLFAFYELIKRRQAGRQLSILLGVISIVSGIVMHMAYSHAHIDGGSLPITDLVKGAVIVLLSYISKD